MPLDGDALAKAFGCNDLKIANQVCRAQIGEFERAVWMDTVVSVRKA
jgi:hypothetical protein